MELSVQKVRCHENEENSHTPNKTTTIPKILLCYEQTKRRFLTRTTCTVKMTAAAAVRERKREMRHCCVSNFDDAKMLQRFILCMNKLEC